MAKEGKMRAVVPKLRFPEFAGDALSAVWLGDVTVESSIRNGDGLPQGAVMGVSKVIGIAPMEERIVGADIARYKVVRKDWFVYNPMRLNIGSIARWHGDAEILVSPDYVVFQCRDEPDLALKASYLDHFRRSTAWSAFVSQGGDGGVRVRIYYKDLARLELALPKREEQQKIADCLASLDELIAAQRTKVEALKAYKRGLMQQLFPRKGELLPRFRFPEFRNAPKWKEVPLGDFFETSSGGTPDRTKREYWTGTVPWVTTSLVDFNVISKTDESISKAGLENSSAKVFPEGTVLIAMYGQGKTRGKVAILGIPAATNQACAAVLPNDDVDSRFTFVSLCGRYEEMRKLSNSGGQENLSQALIRALPFRYPIDVEEQSKIVECFSGIDALIIGEDEKLDKLNIHKKGLMQQLFPYIEYTK